MAQRKQWNDEQLKVAVVDSISIAETLRKLGSRTTGGNYLTINKDIKRLGLDVSHFLGEAHLKGKTHNWTGNRVSLDQILIKDSTYSKTTLKARLLKEGVLKEECAICGNSGTWMNKQLKLQLDHINGDNTDNRLDNLRILCPNCHSQTDTFSRGIKFYLVEERKCSECGGKCSKQSKSGLCRVCSAKRSARLRIGRSAATW